MLVLTGRHDRMRSVEAAQVITEGVPQADLVVFESSGRITFVEENEATSAPFAIFSSATPDRVRNASRVIAVNSPWYSTRGLLAPLRSTCKTCFFTSEPPRTRTWNLEIKSLCRGVSVRFRWLRI